MLVTLDKIKGTLEQYAKTGTVTNTSDIQLIPPDIALLSRVLSDGVITKSEQKQLKARFSDDAIKEIADAPNERIFHLTREIHNNKGPITALLIRALTGYRDYLMPAGPTLEKVVTAKTFFGRYEYPVDARLAAIDVLCPTFTTHESVGYLYGFLGSTKDDQRVSDKIGACFIDYSVEGPCKCGVTKDRQPKHHKVAAK